LIVPGSRLLRQTRSGIQPGHTDRTGLEVGPLAASFTAIGADFPKDQAFLALPVWTWLRTRERLPALGVFSFSGPAVASCHIPATKAITHNQYLGHVRTGVSIPSATAPVATPSFAAPATA
jgi:hypothetical protein